jgi:hypothetical protein
MRRAEHGSGAGTGSTPAPRTSTRGLFARRIHDGRRARAEGRYADALRELSEALALWRDRPLAEVSGMRFARPAIARLDELRLDGVEAEIALGRTARAVSELEALVASHPAREGLTEQLMLALYRSGRQANTLDAYRRTRWHLVGELGLEPRASLSDLQTRILAQHPALHGPASADPDPVVLLPAVPVLVGREDDVAALGALLVGSGARLLTITGPGGVGKTSAAIAVAHAVVGSFADGAVFADLSGVREPGGVPAALLAPLGAPGIGDAEASDRLRDAFAGKAQLLVMDTASPRSRRSDRPARAVACALL